jgi:hypothetical protein
VFGRQRPVLETKGQKRFWRHCLLNRQPNREITGAAADMPGAWVQFAQFEQVREANASPALTGCHPSLFALKVLNELPGWQQPQVFNHESDRRIDEAVDAEAGPGSWRSSLEHREFSQYASVPVRHLCDSLPVGWSKLPEP